MAIMTNTWFRFYQRIKDPSWPDCVHPDFFHRLPADIQHEVLTKHNGQQHLWNAQPVADTIHYAPERRAESDSDVDMDYQFAQDFDPECQKTVDYDRLGVRYDDFMECGGLEYGLNLPRIIQYLCPGRQFQRALEWCSGGGFAGFRLLDLRICQELHLMDLYRPSLRGCERTRDSLPLELAAQVHVHHAKQIQDISANGFDLVIGLPPWFHHRTFASRMFDTRRCVDQAWQAHSEFFANIGKRITSDAMVVLVEHPWGSGPEDFESMIQQGGLRISHCFAEPAESQLCYYLVLEPAL
jgi:hypothetical protein